MLKCIICEKELSEEEDDFPKRLDCWSILYDGIVFKSLGNYGSVEYDPFDADEYLEIAICDDCLVERGHLVSRLEEVRRKKKKRVLEYEFEYEFVETFAEYKKRLDKGGPERKGRKDESSNSVD